MAMHLEAYSYSVAHINETKESQHCRSVMRQVKERRICNEANNREEE